MNADCIFEIFNQEHISYMYLSRPSLKDEDTVNTLDRIVELNNTVDNNCIRDLLLGRVSWRERLVGLAFTVSKGSSGYTNVYYESLCTPIGYSILATCASLLFSLYESKASCIPKKFYELDLDAFDGELSFGLDAVNNVLKKKGVWIVLQLHTQDILFTITFTRICIFAKSLVKWPQKTGVRFKKFLTSFNPI